jgi:hypothetical protein
MFIGMTTRGPLNEPKLILNFTDYERRFGLDPAAGEMDDQVRQFFQNGGQQAHVMRLADGALSAIVDLKDETSTFVVLRLEDRSAGAIGETIRVHVDYNTSSPESTFNLTVFREEGDPRGVIRVVERERFTDLTMNPDSRNYVVDNINRQSNLVKAEPGTGLPSPIKGFSIAGVLMNAGDVAELRSIIDHLPSADGTGSFQISVDGSPFRTVMISKPANLAEINTAIRDPIIAALAPFGKTVRVNAAPPRGSHTVLIIESETDGGNVRIAPSPTKDIAVPMQMGVAQGGLEVDGYATQRPAPTGLFTVLGTGSGNLSHLENFIAANPGTVDNLEMTDSSPASGATASLSTWPATGAEMSTGSLTGEQENSLLNVKENLAYLVQQINASTSIAWSAELHGFRVVLTPAFGGSDADHGASLSTGGGTNLHGSIFSAAANVRRYRLGDFGTTKGNYQVGIRRGTDGDYPQLGDYQGAFTVIDREVDLFNILILPRAKDQGDGVRQLLWPAAGAFCQKRRAFLLVDPKETWRSVDDVINGTTGVQSLRYGLVKDHAAVYWPRVKINTGSSIDPSGTVAGLMARIDANRGVWKAPAGVEADVRGVRGLEYMMSDSENGLINPQAVNAIRVFPNGIVSWGSRTMDGFDNSGNDDYKYIPVRRLALFMEESLYRGLKWVVFEPNDEPLWAQIRLNAGAFMHDLFRQGAFQGQKPKDAYFVKCDSETTTQNDINLGIVNIWVGFAPLKPAEFVILYLQQMAGQIDV